MKLRFKLTGNEFLDATFLVILISASVHLMILVVHAIALNDYAKLNYFSILNFELLPRYFSSWTTNSVLSVVTYVGLYFLAWWVCRKSSKK